MNKLKLLFLILAVVSFSFVISFVQALDEQAQASDIRSEARTAGYHDPLFTNWIDPARAGSDVLNINFSDGVLLHQGRVTAPEFCIGNSSNCVTSWATSSGSSNWDVNGSNIYRSSGNVGIGTNTPQEFLDIRGGNALFTNVFGTTRTSTLNISASSVRRAGGILNVGTQTAHHLYLRTGDLTRMEIQGSTGRVRIHERLSVGTGNWPSTNTLEVGGSSSFDGAVSFNNPTLNTPFEVNFRHYNPSWSDNMYKTFLRKSWTETSGDFLYLGATGNTPSTNQVAILLAREFGFRVGRGTDSGTSLSRTDFVVSPSGQVGIGTSNPSEKLHVAGGALFEENVFVEGALNLRASDGSCWTIAVNGSNGQLYTIEGDCSAKCGPNARTYDYWETSFSNTADSSFCETGDLNTSGPPYSTDFPANPGDVSAWLCNMPEGSQVTCSAYREGAYSGLVTNFEVGEQSHLHEVNPVYPLSNQVQCGLGHPSPPVTLPLSWNAPLQPKGGAPYSSIKDYEVTIIGAGSPQPIIVSANSSGNWASSSYNVNVDINLGSNPNSNTISINILPRFNYPSDSWSSELSENSHDIGLCEEYTGGDIN